MVILVLIAGLAGWCSHDYWMRLGDEAWRKRYWNWSLQGFAFPVLVWCLFNLGLGDRFPALVPQIVDAQQAKEPWIGLWSIWAIIGMILIGVYWTAMTYAWLVARIIAGAEEKQELAFSLALLGVISGSLGVAVVYFWGWIHVGAAVCLALLPIVHLTIDLAEKPPPRPAYSRAIGQMKFGKYQAAEWEVISQLEKSENDFEGWMMLAELYAKQYRKMEDAARVVFDICSHPEAQPYQISLSCHKLADWQLEVAQNPLGARAALEFLSRTIPGTHFARMAEQRIRQIPSSVEEFDESRKPRKIHLPVLREDAAAPSQPAGSRADAAAEANRLSGKLSEDPNDIAARQKLAMVLAEKLGKIDLAAEQLKLLIELEEPTEEQKAQWSAQIATWEFNRDQNLERFSSALRAIIREYPQTSHAFSAQRRLYLLEMDFQHPAVPNSSA